MKPLKATLFVTYIFTGILILGLIFSSFWKSRTSVSISFPRHEDNQTNDQMKIQEENPPASETPAESN